MSKIVKCVKCHDEFEMPDNFMGSILCESCDPHMQTESDKASSKAMTEAEQKAQNLIDKFREYVADIIPKHYELAYDKGEETENAKACALIAVEEILNYVKEETLQYKGWEDDPLLPTHGLITLYEMKTFYQQVKTAITK